MSSANTLTVEFSLPSVGNQEDWLRVTQNDVGTDAASVSDASHVIDAVFGLSACDGSSDVGGNVTEYDSDGNPIPETTSDQFVETANEELGIQACLATQEYVWDASIEIVCSNPKIPYVLDVVGGTVTGKKIFSGKKKVSLILDGVDQKVLDYPVMGDVTGSWATSSVTGAWMVVGSTVVFSKKVTGQLDLEYQTQYDTVTVKVAAVEGESKLQNAEVICFWNKIAEAITLESPKLLEKDLEDTSMCGAPKSIRAGEVTDDRPKKPCTRTVSINYKCQCSGSDAGTSTSSETIECPDGTHEGSEIDATDIYVTEYVDCGEDSSEQITGYSYKVNDPLYYEKVCCFPPNHALPPCPTIHRTWKAGAGILPSREYWQNQNDGKVEIVPVAPPGGICGELVQTWEIPSDCCATAKPVKWNYDDSAETVAQGAVAYVHVLDGVPPFDIYLSGTGFYTNQEYTAVRGQTPYRSIAIYSSPSSCGTCEIGIVDACGTEAIGYIRSSAGSWYYRSELSNSCSLDIPALDYKSTTQGSGYYETFAGKYKVQWNYSTSSGQTHYAFEDAAVGGPACEKARNISCMDFVTQPSECEGLSAILTAPSGGTLGFSYTGYDTRTLAAIPGVIIHNWYHPSMNNMCSLEGMEIIMESTGECYWSAYPFGGTQASAYVNVVGQVIRSVWEWRC